jgi:hypothetical protein
MSHWSIDLGHLFLVFVSTQESEESLPVMVSAVPIWKSQVGSPNPEVPV